MRAPIPTRLRLSQSKILWFVMLIALGLRIAWLITASKVIENEGAEYARIAYNLRSGHVYIGTMAGPQLLFPPLYPVLIAGLSFVTGNIELAARLVSVVAGTLLVAAIFLIADSLYGRRVAMISAMLIACYPLLVALSASTYSECLYITLIYSGLYQVLAWRKTKQTRRAVLAGVFLGLGYLTRPEALPYPLALAALVMVSSLMEAKSLHARLFDGRWRLIFVARSTLLIGICIALTHLALPKTLIYSGALAVPIVLTLLVEGEDWNKIFLQSAWMLIAVAVLASPYVTYLWLHTGQFRLQGKSEVNYLIGARLNSGLDANEATWGLDQNGDAEGPLLNPNRYIGRQPYPPDLRSMLHYLLLSARRNQWELRHLSVFPLLFWPMLLTALAASLPASWSRERLSDERLLICFFALACLPLVIAPVFSVRRLLLPIIPLVLLWSSNGIKELSVRAKTMGSKFLIPRARIKIIGTVVALGLGMFLVYCGERVLTGFPDLLSTNCDRAMKEAGLYLKIHAPGAKRIIDTGTIVSYYSGGTWVPMPWADGTLLLKYIARENPDFVVVNAVEWNRGAMELGALLQQEPRAHLVREFSSAASNKLTVYTWLH